MKTLLVALSLHTLMQPSAEAVYRKPACHTAAVTRSACASSLACTGDSSPPLPIAHDLQIRALVSQQSRPCMQAVTLFCWCLIFVQAALEPKQLVC